MKPSTAYALAILALEDKARTYAVNANLHDIYHSDTPVCVAASAKRKRIKEAIDILRKEMQK